MSKTTATATSKTTSVSVSTSSPYPRRQTATAKRAAATSTAPVVTVTRVPAASRLISPSSSSSSTAPAPVDVPSVLPSAGAPTVRVAEAPMPLFRDLLSAGSSAIASRRNADAIQRRQRWNREYPEYTEETPVTQISPSEQKNLHFPMSTTGICENNARIYGDELVVTGNGNTIFGRGCVVFGDSNLLVGLDSRGIGDNNSQISMEEARTSVSEASRLGRQVRLGWGGSRMRHRGMNRFAPYPMFRMGDAFAEDGGDGAEEENDAESGSMERIFGSLFEAVRAGAPRPESTPVVPRIPIPSESVVSPVVTSLTEEKKKELIEKMTCHFCAERLADHVFSPCLHRVCAQCSRKCVILSSIKCPFCKSTCDSIRPDATSTT